MYTPAHTHTSATYRIAPPQYDVYLYAYTYTYCYCYYFITHLAVVGAGVGHTTFPHVGLFEGASVGTVGA